MAGRLPPLRFLIRKATRLVPVAAFLFPLVRESTLQCASHLQVFVDVLLAKTGHMADPGSGNEERDLLT